MMGFIRTDLNHFLLFMHATHIHLTLVPYHMEIGHQGSSMTCSTVLPIDSAQSGRWSCGGTIAHMEWRLGQHADELEVVTYTVRHLFDRHQLPPVQVSRERVDGL